MPDPADYEIVRKIGQLLIVLTVLSCVTGSCSAKGCGFTEDYASKLIDKIQDQ